MPAADTAKLIAALELKDKFSGPISKAGKSLGAFDARLDHSQSRAFRAGQQIGTGIKNTAKIATVGVGILASQVGLGLNSLIKLESAEAQTAAVLKSTNGAAGVQAATIGKLAEKYESLNATIGDETIRETENLLLTFTKVKGKAFEPALKAILDMNQAMGKGPEGLTATAIQVGKALNDPAKGFTALRRVGVSFTKSQEKRIKALQKEGKLYEAQQIILKELNTEFGGSFLAGGNTTAGKVAKFTDSIEDLQRSLAEALLPAIGNVADGLSDFLADPSVIKGAKDLGVQIGNLFSKENITRGIEVVKGAFQFARDAAPVVAAAAKTMGSVIGTAVKLFQSLPPEIQSLAIGGLAVNKLTGGLVSNLAGGLISSVLKQLVSGVVNVNGGVVNVNGPSVGGAGGAAGAAKGGLGLASKALLVGEAIGLGLLVNEVRNRIADQSTKTSQGLLAKQNVFLANKPSQDAIKSALAGVNQGIADLQSNPLHVLVQGDALKNLQSMKAQLEGALTKNTSGSPDDRGEKQKAEIAKTTASINRMKESQDRGLQGVTHSVQDSKARTAVGQAAIRQATLNVSRDVARHGSATAQAARQAGVVAKSGGIAAAHAINRKKWAVNVRTAVTVNARLAARDAKTKLTFQQKAAEFG